jgi:multiple sugar transport system substrate-binding protein
MATPVTSPHAFATIASLMANLGSPIATAPERPFAFDRRAMAAALDTLDAVLAYSPPETLDWNAIQPFRGYDRTWRHRVHPFDLWLRDLWGSRYARAAALRKLLRPCFAISRWLNAGRNGLAVSAGTKHKEAAVAFTRFCLSPLAQERIIPDYHGQPALVSAWENVENDARFGKFFSGVRASIEMTWIRPRRPRYIRF